MQNKKHAAKQTYKNIIVISFISRHLIPFQQILKITITKNSIEGNLKWWPSRQNKKIVVGIMPRQTKHNGLTRTLTIIAIFN